MEGGFVNITELIDQYIESKKLAWARTSLKNERYRLKCHGHRVFSEPSDVYQTLKKEGLKDHSLKTLFVRLGQFHDFLVETDRVPPAKNPWKRFLKENAMVFKYAYQIERVTVTFDEAKSRIQTLEEPYRSASLQLLEGGLRYCELRTFDGLRVIGKGSKPRTVFLRPDLGLFRYTGSYSALYVRLKAVGLKPHTLRKLCATEFSRLPEVKDQDICKTFGWSSIETSIKYRQPHNDEALKEQLQRAVAGVKKESNPVKALLAKLLEKVTI